ncbi:hypothetical protein KXJ72_11355 [Comamonas aquatica]|nr:hypothetical protein KXJ72_11355 [Comamonas aquatica]
MDHLVNLALSSPGWWEYVKWRARELDQVGPPLFQDVEKQVAQKLQAHGFRPPRHESRMAGSLEQ